MLDLKDAKHANALKTLLRRAATDRPFRDLCLRDPIGAAKQAGLALPAGAKVRFVEDVEESTVLLPHFIDTSSVPEESLQKLAFGVREVLGTGSDNTPCPAGCASICV